MNNSSWKGAKEMVVGLRSIKKGSSLQLKVNNGSWPTKGGSRDSCWSRDLVKGKGRKETGRGHLVIENALVMAITPSIQLGWVM